MQYTMFKAEGTPVRAVVPVQNWLLDCRFQPGQAAPTAGINLIAHELTHVVNQGTTVRVWHLVKNRLPHGARPMQPAFSAAGRTAQFLPEVDDEVLVSFQHGTPRATAIVFNPTELSVRKTVPWGNQLPTGGAGDVGMIREGNYRVVVQQRTGGQPLRIALMVAADSRTMRDARLFPLI